MAEADTHTYSADELKALASALDGLAEALPVDTPGEEGLEMTRWAQAVGGAASNLRLMAVRDYVAQAQEPLADIVQATSEAKEAIRKIKQVAKAIELVGDALLLSTVIWLQKWNLVGPTLKELRSDIKG